MNMKARWTKTIVPLLAALPFALLLQADNHGADPALTAAPGEPASTCTACHTGTALNAGGGSVKIVLPGDKTYTPGVAQRIKVQINDASQRRWGYELTARLASDPSSAQAGDLAIVDGNSQVMCSNGRAKPCASAETIQFITHTLAGSRNGTAASVQFEFDWTPPAVSRGRITLYAAANAANGDNRNSGDHIYTTSVDLEPADAAPVKPAIRSERGVVNAASLLPGAADESWVSIFGTNLAATTRTWTPADFQDTLPPTSLDGVSVTINGKAAYLQAVSPTRITVLSPADDSVGPVEVRVTNGNQTSDPAIVELLPLAPAFFLNEGGKHLLISEPEKSLISDPALMPVVKPEKTAAKPGETILIYGTGFGPTDPEVPLTEITESDDEAKVVTPLTITIAGAAAEIISAKLVPGAVHLYQFVVKVPDGLTDGDQTIVAQIGSARSPAAEDCCFVTIQQ